MIRRDEGNDWLLISQVDHAHLAAEIAEVWGNEIVPALPLPELLIPAIRDHDEGWRDWECAPQVDVETGSPRDFTEMPMAVATEIWSKSIDAAVRGETTQAPALKAYHECLAGQGESLNGDRAAALESLLQFRASFRREEVGRKSHQAEVPAEVFELMFDDLTRVGIVRPIGRDVLGAYYCVDLPQRSNSPLGGLWVSRHFCYLAEMARESREGNADDLNAIDEFLSEQKLLQDKWTDDSLRNFAGGEINRLIETGYRYTQFFDRMSLWLCCAERTTDVEMKLPGGETFRVIPEPANRIRIEPFPLSIATLELSVNVRRISATSYVGDELLQEAIARGSVERLSWTLTR